MVIYIYRCDSCGVNYEKYLKMGTEQDFICDSCGKVLRKLYVPVNVLYRGKGFYKTDNT